MSQETFALPSPGAGLLSKLMAAVRPEFRVDVFIPEPGELIFGLGVCRVPGCPRQPRTRQLCRGHYYRWQRRGKPDVEAFIADPGADPVGRSELTACAIAGCRFGAARQGLCVSHNGFWERAGKPDKKIWTAGLPVVEDDGRRVCRLSFCTLWAQGKPPFCHNHNSRWQAVGRPEIEEFVRRCEAAGDDRFDFRPLDGQRQLRLELQYALQCRHDDRQVNTHSSAVAPVIRLAAASGTASLLEWPMERWSEYYAAMRGASHSQNGQLAFLRYAYTHLEDLVHGNGWESEFPRDVWELRRLGIEGTRARLRFDRITQPWLREPAKRFVRWRLSIGRSINQAVVDILALNRFSGFLADPRVAADKLTRVDRTVLERYLADLAQDPRSTHSRSRDIGSLNAFFNAVRRHGWDQSLPANATFYPDDFPRPDKRLPRALAEHVMAQVEQPANLDRWHNPDGRVLTLILMRCGLRVGDACNLAFDCIIRDADGAAYVRYLNRKMKREALVPIDEEVENEITTQQQRVLDRWPSGSRWLFPAPRMNPDGTRPLTTHSYRGQLDLWLERCYVRDEHGRAVHLTPHQWRHTFGTRLINRDVPQEVVRVLLDHSSGEMTAHYARLHDTTVRRHWEKARKVNIQGESVTVDPQGPLAEATWAKQRLGRVTQALPNGYCGLPVQKTCPHANACLTCPMFVTTPEFLPQHREQRQQLLQIVSAAQARGQAHVAEMNRQVLGNLEKIITGLEDDPGQPEATADAS
ncbi:site-specific integrase [Streptomyces sp. NBC_01549]|uniref:tyrosine-type recombinase/integrase n=2 Tax=unclassified Streptomyces TaxID=2593676 RepID=UPI002251E5A1|nr:tyrosine-type recombinase/integrase [Streptomyces sp. NBC_01549]MCX4597550.1 site-specific integrase [Streptomyces sp. NBC_01549]